ncbi:uncharacterized protein LOC135086466 [Ostrinia nubilalis]|uniref:uncharacterized protein LOC135086466 n=1 Tax=Ostrinia nubilalis TaxID=29057 RepID=UPI0030825F35
MRTALLCCLLGLGAAVKVKVVMHSEQDESRADDDERAAPTLLPFLKARDDDAAPAPAAAPAAAAAAAAAAADRPRALHPNEMIFPLIYRQSHINSMFKFGENWYTWSTEKRTDGSKATNYYICYDEPKRCDEIGWERTDALPKCAFQIDSLLPEDRACINPFGVEPRAAGSCDGAEQMKVSEMVRACGPRIRSLWRFLRVGRRPAGVAKPADVNSLVCEDEEECYLTVEYRIHHDRITFSLHEPTRGQTFKSALKREAEPEPEPRSPAPPPPPRAHRKKPRDEEPPRKKFRVRARPKAAEGKGVVKERNDSGYAGRRAVKNKIKIREDVSEDMSE